jgi:hypothetical protein
MNMIDVIKRLAELDAQNPNVVTEGADALEVTECGPMSTMVSPSQPAMPASINVTAGSGQEVSDMLSAIMQLAGVKPVGGADLGVEHEPMSLTAEPVSAVGPAATAGDEMRSVMDKLNGADGEEGDEEASDELDSDDDQEETDEGEYNNSPSDPTELNAYPKNSVGTPGTQDAAGNPGVGDRNDGKQPKAFPTFESLMAEYQQFVNE